VVAFPVREDNYADLDFCRNKQIFT